MVSRSLVLGYHGCDLAVAQKIVSGQSDQHPSANEYDWLGNGLYFWEDSPARALQWAQDETGGKIRKPAVLGAIIDLGNCLNLIDAEHLSLVRAAHRAYLEFCAVADLKPAFDSVRAFFVEGDPLYEDAGLHALDHIQICVRNPRQIVGYFPPRKN